jgi:hypothetical protein
MWTFADICSLPLRGGLWLPVGTQQQRSYSYSFMTLRGVVSVTERVPYCLPRVIIILNKNLRLVVNLKLRRLSERMRNNLLPPGQ